MIETNPEYVKFSVQSEIIGGSIKLKQNTYDETGEKAFIKVLEPVNLAFALRYLNMFTKASSISDKVALFLSTEYPLMVEYELMNLGILRFYLAPRISEENK